jgi:flavorubredoxin
MLHWPDTMFTYMDGENILFSNDGFGQHYATESLYDDRVDMAEMLYEAKKYYANILAPFSMMVTRKLNEILAMNLPLNMVCPSHGVIWRKNIGMIIDLYKQWAANYQENKITIVYDTMWNSTRIMAQEIARGIQEVDKEVEIKIYNAAKEDKNDVLTDIFASKAILVGSPTINNGLAHAVAGLLEMAKGMKLKNKKAAAFGSYGWSGEAVGNLSAKLTQLKYNVQEGMRVKFRPSEADLEAARECGKSFAELVKAR